jgi:hypothetical protein
VNNLDEEFKVAKIVIGARGCIWARNWLAFDVSLQIYMLAYRETKSGMARHCEYLQLHIIEENPTRQFRSEARSETA